MGLSIADGYIVSASDYDNLIYCIGKGPSATTVSASNAGIPLGSSLTISGTVMDTSPGAMVKGPQFGYANGIPAVSDASEEAFMEYIYEQQIQPTNTTGVPVTISAIDPNGNFVSLGTVTSDLSGFYSLGVNTNMLGAGAGTYKVIASFAGSGSYGSSYAESAFTINSAPAATAAPTATPTSAADLYFVPAIAGLFVLIIVVAIVLALLMLRKKS